MSLPYGSIIIGRSCKILRSSGRRVAGWTSCCRVLGRVGACAQPTMEGATLSRCTYISSLGSGHGHAIHHMDTELVQMYLGVT